MERFSTDSPTPRLYKIGELSSAVGFSVRTVRYYDEAGLVRPVARSDGGFRLYDEGALKKLDFVKRARELGISLDRIRLILDCFESGEGVCSHVDAAIAEELREIDEQVAKLSALRRQLVAVRAELKPRLSSARAEDCVCPVLAGREL